MTNIICLSTFLVFMCGLAVVHGGASCSFDDDNLEAYKDKTCTPGQHFPFPGDCRKYFKCTQWGKYKCFPCGPGTKFPVTRFNDGEIGPDSSQANCNERIESSDNCWPRVDIGKPCEDTEASNQDCKGGAYCTYDKYWSLVCTCKAGTVPNADNTACVEPLPECSPACQNNGICTPAGTCLCTPGYTGASCETAIDNPIIQINAVPTCTVDDWWSRVWDGQKPDSCTPNEHIGHPYDCRKYYKCGAGGHWQCFPCGPGTAFNGAADKTSSTANCGLQGTAYTNCVKAIPAKKAEHLAALAAAGK